jgi:hypothetical protein
MKESMKLKLNKSGSWTFKGLEDHHLAAIHALMTHVRLDGGPNSFSALEILESFYEAGLDHYLVDVGFSFNESEGMSIELNQ